LIKDIHKVDELEPENARLLKEVKRLEAELELRVSQTDYENAFEEVERENAVCLSHPAFTSIHSLLLNYI
jgi:hypothetical protein